MKKRKHSNPEKEGSKPANKKMPAKKMAKMTTKDDISSIKKKLIPEIKKTPSKVTTILPNKNEKRCYKCPNCKNKKNAKFPRQNSKYKSEKAYKL
jgi:hypothetical protein